MELVQFPPIFIVIIPLAMEGWYGFPGPFLLCYLDIDTCSCVCLASGFLICNDEDFENALKFCSFLKSLRKLICNFQVTANITNNP